MKRVGLHIRLTTLQNLIEKATQLNVPFFQTFLVSPEGTLVKPTLDDTKFFLSARDAFGNLYLHGSFWINLCSNREYSMHVLKKELALARQLEFTHLILHPGSAKDSATKIDGIDILARMLNKILKTEKTIKIILENTAHGGMTVGNDLNDFALLREKLDYEVQYCLDTAHAYAFGYDIIHNLNDFMNLVDKTIGFDAIALVHLNDTPDALGSKKDRHVIIGDGNLGIEPLKQFVLHPALRHIPIILEPPPVSIDEEHTLFTTVHTW